MAEHSEASQEEEERNQLKLLFYACSFFLLGTILRHLGVVFSIKRTAFLGMYIVGTMTGVIAKYLNASKDPIMDQCGPFCLQSVYLPLFLFDMGFLVDTRDVRPKMVIFVLTILVPVWVLSVTAISFAGIYLVTQKISWKCYMAMAIVSACPDIQAIRMVFQTRFNPWNPVLKSVLEIEAIIGAIVVPIVFNGLRGKEGMSAFLPLEIILAIILGIIVGELTTTWLKRIHNDTVIHTTISVATIFITFSIAKSFGMPAELSVFVMSIFMMRAKPSLSAKTIESMTKFVEIFHFSLVCVVIGTAGMQLVNRVGHLFKFKYLALSFLFFCISSGIRLFIVLLLWPLYRRFCFGNINDALTISMCNFQGPYNVIFSLVFLDMHANDWMCANNDLFLLASFNVIISFVIMVPVTNKLLGALRRRRLDLEKMEMIYNCANILNDLKTSFTDVLRKLAFTADADWDVVAHRTRIKKGFFKTYGIKKFVQSNAEKHPDVLAKQIRRESIRFLLRSQRRDLEEQFEKGLVTSSTAKALTREIMTAYSNKNILTAEAVMKAMKPNKYMLKLHSELTEAIAKGSTSIRNKAYWIAVTLTLYFNGLRLMSFIFNYQGYILILSYMSFAYNVFITLIFILCVIRYRPKKVIPIRYKFLLLTTLLSILESVGDFVSFLFVKSHVLGLNSIQVEYLPSGLSFLNHMMAGISIIIFFLRVICIAYGITFFKMSMFKLLQSLLDKASYVQCEAGLCFMYVTRDTLHQLPDAILDSRIMNRLQIIMHQEAMSTRQYLCLLDILSPEIMVSLKTFIASRSILNSQLDVMTKLRDDGFFGDLDYEQLHNVIQEKMRILHNSSLSRDILSLKQLLKNHPLMAENETKLEYLLKFGKILNFKPGEMIVDQGVDPGGLFIIYKGFVRSECRTQQSSHRSKGPVYFTKHALIKSSERSIELTDFLSTGAVLGERDLLTERPSHKSIRCASRVKTFYIPHGNIHELMGGRPKWDGLVSILESKMWKCIAIRIASRMLQAAFNSESTLTHRRVYQMLEQSQLIFAEPQKILKLNHSQYLAIILIHGSVWTIDKEHHYIGPCFLPQRAGDVDLEVDSGRRTVILEIPGGYQTSQEETELSFLRSRGVSQFDDMEDYSDDMTTSSNASDGIPHRRHRDSLFHATNKKNDSSL